MFLLFEEAIETFERQGIRRHFLEKDQLFHPSGDGPVALSNQRGSGNHERFIEQANKLGYELSAIQ